MKKSICLLLVLCILLTLLPMNTVFAESYGDLSYYIEDGEAVISRCSSDATGVVEIPDSIEGYPVTTIRDGAFYMCRNISGITIPESVTAIEGDHVFRECYNLKSIMVPKSVLEIGEGVFYDSGLTEILVEDGNPSYVSVDGVLYTKDGKTIVYYPKKESGDTVYTIPSGVTRIADYAFYGKNGLETIEIPDTVTEIGERAFSSSQLKHVELPSSVTKLGYWSFAYCYDLESVSIPGVKALESGTFLDCHKLSEIVLPDSLEKIGGHVFCDTAISQITIPPNVTEISGGAFARMFSLESVQVDPRNTSFVMKDGVLYSADGKTLVSGCQKSGDYTIPEGTEEILDNAFWSCNLTGVSLPSGLKAIGERAFLMTNISNVTVPGNVERIEYATFESCTQLENVVLEEGVTRIGSYAFDECSSLTEITIPKSVSSIGNDAFTDCDSLSDVYYAGSREDWEMISIDDINGSKNAALLNANIHFKTTDAYLVLDDYTDEQLSSVPLRDILDKLQDADGNKIEVGPAAEGYEVQFIGEDDLLWYDHLENEDETVDLSEFKESPDHTMVLIAGGGEESDSEYHVHVIIPADLNDVLTVSFFSKDENGNETAQEPIRQDSASSVISGSKIEDPDTGEMKDITLLQNNYQFSNIDYSNFYFRLHSALAEENPDISVVIYEAEQLRQMIEDGEDSSPVTKMLLETGYPCENQKYSFYVLYYQNGVLIDVVRLNIALSDYFIGAIWELWNSVMDYLRVGSGSPGSGVMTLRAVTFSELNKEDSNTIDDDFHQGGNDQPSDDTPTTPSQPGHVVRPTTDWAVENVQSLIDRIPTSPSLRDRDDVSAARAAYDRLSGAQKNKVTNYDRLKAAEAAIQSLQADKAVAEKVVTKIDSIPNPVTMESKDAVQAARADYNLLTASQKQFVDNYVKLSAAEDAIAQLEAEARADEKSQAEINAVIAAIHALPDTITVSDQDAVQEARDAYNALLDEQKAKVVNYEQLVQAEAAIAALQELENASAADRAAVQQVIDQIDALPDAVKLTDKDTVQAARDAYDALTDAQKAMVGNASKLTDAEKTIAALEAYAEASPSDRAAADRVMELIRSLPSPLTLADQDAVANARNAYNALTDAKKALIANEKDLIAAEARIAELKNAAPGEQKPASVTMVCRVVGVNGAALVNYLVELHSTVQTARSDSNGYVRFTNVEMGSHTLIVRDANNQEVASKSFRIVEGKPLAISGDEITAEDGSTFTLTVQVQNEGIGLLTVASGDQAPIPKEAPSGSSAYGQGTGMRNGAPRTGDSNHLMVWYILFVLSTIGLLVMLRTGGRKKKTEG